MSQGWVSRLVARYRADGDAALEPRSRRPRTRPRQTSAATAELVVDLRRTLTRQGLDAGPVTIAWHLHHHHHIALSRATIYRILRRAELVVPEPKKKPRSSYVRFQAEQPNETWQSDVTHWRLANGVDVEIITWLDDHSRYALSVSAHLRVTGRTVLATFRTATDTHGIPFSTLTDNGLIFTTRFAQGGITSRNAFETELVRLRVRQKNSRPNHPTTCGKVERFQQTMKRWLRAQPAAASLEALQQLLDHFVEPLQPPPPAPLPHPSRHPSRGLRRPTQSQPQHQHHQRPPRPPRPHRQDRQSHTPPPRHPVPHRHRPTPRRRPHPPPRPRPRHPHHPRHHRRDHPPTHPRHHPHLPTHRRQTRRTQTPLRTPKKQEARTLTWVQALPMSRDITGWSWGESNPRPSGDARPCYDHSRLPPCRWETGGSVSRRSPGGPRVVFPACQQAFLRSAVFPAAIPRFCCRAAVDRPRAPSLVTMSVGSPEDQAATANCSLAILGGCPV